MRLTRIYVDRDLETGQTLTLPPRPALHLVQVLRLRPGDRLLVFNGDGRDFPAQVLAAQRPGVQVRVEIPGAPEPDPPLRIHLGIGITKGDRMDFALQKAVELGVAAISPLFAGRAVVRLAGERLAKRLEHWRGVVISACEQSGRRRLPTLHPAQPLEAWLRQGHPTPLLLDHRASRALPSLDAPGPALTLLIGPEGGLAPAERELAYGAGFTGVSLGPRILRAETAPLAALAIAQALWGDIKDKNIRSR